MVPAGTWHNVTNTGNIPLKLYSIYAPPNHPFGTVHVTKADAMAAEEGYVMAMEIQLFLAGLRMNGYSTQNFW